MTGGDGIEARLEHAARHSVGFIRFATSLAKCGYHLAWRVLDCASPEVSDQPRPRLFLVGSMRGPEEPFSILFEPEGAGRNIPQKTATTPVLTARGAMAFDDRTPCVLGEHGPRIATPLEWERVMGFPDGLTGIPRRNGKPAADGPRYKALGNSMAVNVVRWVGQRIALARGAS